MIRGHGSACGKEGHCCRRAICFCLISPAARRRHHSGVHRNSQSPGCCGAGCCTGYDRHVAAAAAGSKVDRDIGRTLATGNRSSGWSGPGITCGPTDRRYRIRNAGGSTTNEVLPGDRTQGANAATPAGHHYVDRVGWLTHRVSTIIF